MWSLVVLAFVIACGPRESEPRGQAPVVSTPAPPTFLKGQLHAHTDRSSDSETPIADVIRWYEDHDYDFLVLTDHNRISRGEGREMLVIPGVELTQNLETCDPAPPPGMRCHLHVNSLFAAGEEVDWPPDAARMVTNRRYVLWRALEANRAAFGLAQLNHPNFHAAVDADLLSALCEDGLRLFEVRNEAVDSDNGETPAHVSTEALWDQVLSRGHVLYGTATDDAHHYDDAARVRARGDIAYTGDRGFVMVRAARRRADIRRALEAGDFYASTGVLLTRLDIEGTTVSIATAEPHDFTFIGREGRTLAHTRGLTAQHTLAPGEGYVRAVISDGRGRIALTQPVFEVR